MYRILVAEDEQNIRNLIKLSFEGADYKVIEAINGEEAIQMAQEYKPDLIILDVMMPKKNGFQVIEYLRGERNKTPIIILSAKMQEEDKIKGFKLGADDYQVKPFSIDELLLRCNAVLNRCKEFNKIGKNIEIEVDNLSVKFDDKVVEFYKMEFNIFVYLYENRLRYVSRDELEKNLQTKSKTGKTRTIDIHISAIRKRLKEANIDVKIETKRGVGYKLVE